MMEREVEPEESKDCWALEPQRGLEEVLKELLFQEPLSAALFSLKPAQAPVQSTWESAVSRPVRSHRKEHSGFSHRAVN